MRTANLKVIQLQGLIKEHEYMIEYIHSTLSIKTGYHSGMDYYIFYTFEEGNEIDITIDDLGSSNVVMVLWKKEKKEDLETMETKFSVKLSTLTENFEHELRIRGDENPEIQITIRIKLKGFGLNINNSFPFHPLFSPNYRFDHIFVNIVSYLSPNFILNILYFVSKHFQKIIRYKINTIDCFEASHDLNVEQFLSFFSSFPNILEFRVKNNSKLIVQNLEEDIFCFRKILNISKEIEPKLQILELVFSENGTDDPKLSIVNVFAILNHFSSLKKLSLTLGRFCSEDFEGKNDFKLEKHLNLVHFELYLEKDEATMSYSNLFEIFSKCEKLRIFQTVSSVYFTLMTLVENQGESVLDFPFPHIFRERKKSSLVEIKPDEKDVQEWGEECVVLKFIPGNGLGSYCINEYFIYNGYFMSFTLVRRKSDGRLVAFINNLNLGKVQFSTKIELSITLNSGEKIFRRIVIRNSMLESNFGVTLENFKITKLIEIESSLFTFTIQLMFHDENNQKNRELLQENDKYYQAKLLLRNLRYDLNEIFLEFDVEKMENIIENGKWSIITFRFCKIEWSVRLEIENKEKGEMNEFSLKIFIDEGSEEGSVVANCIKMISDINVKCLNNEEIRKEFDVESPRVYTNKIMEAIPIKKSDSKIRFVVGMKIKEAYNLEDFHRMKLLEKRVLMGLQTDDVTSPPIIDPFFLVDFLKQHESKDSVELQVDFSVGGELKKFLLFSGSTRWEFSIEKRRNSLVTNEKDQYVYDFSLNRDFPDHVGLSLSYIITIPSINLVLSSCESVYKDNRTGWGIDSVKLPKELNSLENVIIDVEIGGILMTFDQLDEFVDEEIRKAIVIKKKKLHSSSIQETKTVEIKVDSLDRPTQMKETIDFYGIKFLLEFFPMGWKKKNIVTILLTPFLWDFIHIYGKFTVQDLDVKEQTPVVMLSDSNEFMMENVSFYDISRNIFRFKVSFELIEVRNQNEEFSDEEEYISSDGNNEEEEGNNDGVDE